MKYKCFIDMDGVLVDWVGGCCKINNLQYPYNDPKNFGKDLSQATGIHRDSLYKLLEKDFWLDLNPLPWYNDLLAELEALYLNRTALLTAPTWNDGCHAGKREWVNKHIPRYKRKLFVGTDKFWVAAPNHVLIDDSDDKIKGWQNEGGKGILFPQPWNKLSGYTGNKVEYVIQQIRTRGLM